MSDRSIAVLEEFSTSRAAFLEGADSPLELLNKCLENIRNHEAHVQAFAHLDISSAQRDARDSEQRYRSGRPLSPVDGMPIGVKDIIDTSDMPTEMNSPYFTENRPRIDAACVAAARRGGAVILGKTVTTEFALGRSGPTRNPHNPDHTPGGSSSGSAAGTASGMFAAGLGTQTLGSILRPASFNGVVGFKPTYGAISLAGVHPLSRSHDHLGVIAQSVDTAWTLAHLLARGAPGADPSGAMTGPSGIIAPAAGPVRLAVLRPRGMDELDSASLLAFENLLGNIAATGVTLVEAGEDVRLARLLAQFDSIPEISEQMVAFDMTWPFGLYRDQAPEMIGPALGEWIGRGDRVTIDDYRRFLTKRSHDRQMVLDLRSGYDGFVLPAAAGPAPRGLASTGSRILQQYWSYLGFPSFSLPLMQVHHMPFGLQLAGFPHRDDELARVAKRLTADLAGAG